eukprot:1781086-Pleurochrysis_carterae.AAC.1
MADGSNSSHSQARASLRNGRRTTRQKIEEVWAKRKSHKLTSSCKKLARAAEVRHTSDSESTAKK